MTYEEALVDIQKQCERENEDTSCEAGMCCDEYCWIYFAKKAVERMVKKKYRGSYKHATCPTCRCKLRWPLDFPYREMDKFCPKCGQAIDWSGNETEVEYLKRTK